MVGADLDLEQFVTESFDSDEAVMLVLTLRRSQPLTLGQLYDRLAAEFGVPGGEERRVVEKRLELRLRDLTARHLVGDDGYGRYRYSADDAIDELIARVETIFHQRPADLMRMIYSRSARARRLAEAFKL